MFSIFKPKKYLADALGELTDIHCHLLPGLDDGSDSLETSLLMLNLYQELGYNKIIVTPHIMEDLYQLNPDRIRTEAQEFIGTLQQKGVKMTIGIGAEHMTDRNFHLLLETGKLLPLKDRMVLIETGFLHPPLGLKQTLFDMVNRGYVPVLAHPERYQYLRSRADFLDLKNRGCMLQVNLLSLAGHYGPDVMKKAFMLLENNLADCIGTDAHRPSHLMRIKEARIPGKQKETLAYVADKTRAYFQ